MSISTSQIILAGLSRSPAFSSIVYPHLKEEYFNSGERIVYNIINLFISKYSSLPTKEAIIIELENTQGINQTIYNDAEDCISGLFEYELKDVDWLKDTAEKYCKDMALHLALIEAVSIADKISSGKGAGITETAIPELLMKAVSLSFNNDVGIDYLEEPKERYIRYHNEEYKIPFDLEIFNTITDGGFSKGTENIFLAGTASGKSLTMCSFASDNLRMGRNVLYVTLELDDLRTAQRIDSNLLDVDINTVKNMGEDLYVGGIEELRKKTLGKLIIHEDLSGNFNSLRMKALLENLKIKKGFVPDIVYLDYLTIATSSAFKVGVTTSYIYYKSVAEEMRLLAKQYDFALVSCVQLNRSAYQDSDATLVGISESWGIASTADFIAVIMQGEELKAMNQYEFKQLKSRYSDLSENIRFCVGVEKIKMRLYSLNNTSVPQPQPSQENVDVMERLSKLKKNTLIF